jgi:Fe-S-cluster containining protein
MEARITRIGKTAKHICTACGYCMPCPHGVDIPQNFLLLTRARFYGQLDWARGQYARMKARKEGDKSAEVCRRCGACCQGPGDVILTDNDAARIAQQMNLDVYAFTSQYTRLLADRAGLSLTERPDGACVFLTNDNQCRIENAKPLQCRGFPFIWRSERLASQCPGLEEKMKTEF